MGGLLQQGPIQVGFLRLAVVFLRVVHLRCSHLAVTARAEVSYRSSPNLSQWAQIQVLLIDGPGFVSMTALINSSLRNKAGVAYSVVLHVKKGKMFADISSLSGNDVQHNKYFHQLLDGLHLVPLLMSVRVSYMSMRYLKSF